VFDKSLSDDSIGRRGGSLTKECEGRGRREMEVMKDLGGTEPELWATGIGMNHKEVEVRQIRIGSKN